MSQRRVIPLAAKVGRYIPRASSTNAVSHLSLLHQPTAPISPFAALPHYRSLTTTKKSPFDSNNTTTKSTKPKRKKFTPPKAAVELTPKARKFFKLLLENPPRSDIVGVMLNLNHSTAGQPRMVFTFDFVSQDQISEDDEGVSLEVLEDGSPKPPKDSIDDGLPKLYVNRNGFMKALGSTLDVDIEKMQPILYDPEGNIKDPNV